jgi:hypothetical protein
MSLFCCPSSYKLTLLSTSLMSFFYWPPPVKLILLFVCTWAIVLSFSILAYHVVFYGRDYCVSICAWADCVVRCAWADCVVLCAWADCCPLRMSWLCCPSTCQRILLTLYMSLFWYPSAPELFCCPLVYYLILLAICIYKLMYFFILLACLLLVCTWLITYVFYLHSRANLLFVCKSFRFVKSVLQYITFYIGSIVRIHTAHTAQS